MSDELFEKFGDAPYEGLESFLNGPLSVAQGREAAIRYAQASLQFVDVAGDIIKSLIPDRDDPEFAVLGTEDERDAFMEELRDAFDIRKSIALWTSLIMEAREKDDWWPLYHAIVQQAGLALWSGGVSESPRPLLAIKQGTMLWNLALSMGVNANLKQVFADVQREGGMPQIVYAENDLHLSGVHTLSSELPQITTQHDALNRGVVLGRRISRRINNFRPGIYSFPTQVSLEGEEEVPLEVRESLLWRKAAKLAFDGNPRKLFEALVMLGGKLQLAGEYKHTTDNMAFIEAGKAIWSLAHIMIPEVDVESLWLQLAGG